MKLDLTKVDLKKEFKKKLSIADNMEELIDYFVNWHAPITIYYKEDEEDEEEYFFSHCLTNGKSIILVYDEDDPSGDPFMELEDFEEMLMFKFKDGLTLFEYLTGDKPITKKC